VNARWWLVLERVQAGLPVLVAAGLAAFTWWLVQSSPQNEGPARAAQASSAPDYALQEARVARFDRSGRLEAVVDGKRMRHYPQPDRLLIDEVQLLGRDENGQGLRATARQGEADQVAEVVTLRGGARVVATPAPGKPGGPVRFEGEALSVNTRDRVVSSSVPVTLSQDGDVVRGQSMRHDERTGVTVLGGRVTGRYQGPSR
jgi:lipopolysaccharide export system protein LptC